LTELKSTWYVYVAHCKELLCLVTLRGYHIYQVQQTTVTVAGIISKLLHMIWSVNDCWH